jgi:Mn-dependent DtxR family transcriptional regulator
MPDRGKTRAGFHGDNIMRTEDHGFKPGQLQYLYCFYNVPESNRKADAVASKLRISKATAYRKISLLREKNLLVKNGDAYELTEQGRRLAGMFHRMWDNLLFWLRVDMGFGRDAARRYATDMLLGQPMSLISRIAERGASHAALFRVGGDADDALSAITPGRHYVSIAVYMRGGDVPSMGDKGFRKPAVWIADEYGRCALELRNVELTYTAKDGTVLNGHLERLWVLNPQTGEFTEVFEIAERRHIRGDAVKCINEDGELLGRVRIKAMASVGTNHMPVSEADLVIYFAEEIKNDEFFLPDY